MPSPIVYLLFFISGISGLVYQVIWVRQFGFVFGSTVHSAALVTAVFMCGLGLGSYFIGRWSDRVHGRNAAQPLKLYGYFELAIAALGFLILIILPGLEALAAKFTVYSTGAEGWLEVALSSHLLRLVTAVVLLAPITFLMGGTLTLLVRYFLVADLSRAGMRVGALYGLNTAGAALGAFFTDFSLVPNLGVDGAQLVAIILNTVAGVGALLLLRGRADATAKAADCAAPAAPSSSAVAAGQGGGLLWGTALTLFISGFVAMGLEMFWFRYLISGLGGLRSVFSLMLTVILTGIFLGAFVGGYLERRTGKPVTLYIVGQLVLVVMSLAPLYLLGAHVLTLVDPQYLFAITGDSAEKFRIAELVTYFQSIVFVLGIPAFAMGFTFPLANAHVQRVESAIGGRAGSLYLANTLGNVAGSLAAGFLLLPLLGQQQTVTLLALLGLVGLLPLYLTARGPAASRERSASYAFAVGGLLCLGLLFSWVRLPDNYLIYNLSRSGHEVLAVSEGINENVVVTDSPEGRRLWTNGHSMSGTEFSAQRYMRLFSHLPLLNMENPKSVLVICFGVGSTLHAASLHDSIEQLEIADLSRNVLRQNHHFNPSNRGVINDPRLTVYVNDGRQHLRMQPEGKYDLVTLEPPPVSFAGVASLYSTEFYLLARERLREGGYMTQWLPAYQVPTETTLAIVRSFVDAFPNAVLLSGYDNELILMGRKGRDPMLEPQLVARHLRQQPAVREDLERIAAGTLPALAATFIAGPEVLRAATSGTAAVTDDNPSMEYTSYSNYLRTRLPEALFDSREFAQWCPDCMLGERFSPEFREMPYLLEALGEYYQSDFFLNYAFNLPPMSETRARYWQDPCALREVRNNAYFQEIFACRTDQGRSAVPDAASAGSGRAVPAVGEL